MNVTLNGCMAGPNGELDWHYNRWSDDMARATAAQLGNADTILLGRKTYEAMAGYWQGRAKDIFGARVDADFVDMMNGHTKVVFSRRLKRAGNWENCRLAKRPVAKEVAALKQTDGKDIIIYGSGNLVSALREMHLVDEYRLWIHPVVLNKGRPLFTGHEQGLQFSSKTTFASGVVLMNYKAVASP